jgi:hypothetical protein
MLDLDEPRDVRQLLQTTFGLYRTHLWTLLAMAAVVVIPANLLLGLGLGQFGAHYRSHPETRTAVIEFLVSLLVVTPLLNASITQMLLDLGAGRTARARNALTVGLDRFAPAFVAVVIYCVGVGFGFLILLFPGVYVAVLWYFGPQIAVAEKANGMQAIATSGRLIQRQWFRVAGSLLAVTIVGGLPYSGAVLGAEQAGRGANLEVVALLITTVSQIILLPLVALGGSLLYFDVRTRSAAMPATRPRR